MDLSEHNNGGPPGPHDERTLDRWQRKIGGLQDRLGRRASSKDALDEAVQGRAINARWSVRVETWFFRFAVFAAILMLLYAGANTLLWYRAAR